MISWIQNHLIRHGRWIFLTLLTVIIVAFVFTIGNTPGCTTNQSGYEAQPFYGYDLNSSHEMEKLSQKLLLSTILKTGRPLQNQQQFQSQLLSRITMLHIADTIGIPAPSKNSLANYIQSQALFRGPDGEFSNDAYTRFIDTIETDPDIQQDLIVLVLEEDYRIAQVEAAISGPGYFLPSEAISQVQLNRTVFKIAVAEINYNTFDPEIPLSEYTLGQFYTDNIMRYKIPERMQTSYVKFPVAPYKASVDTFSEEELRAHFTANRARFVAAYETTQTKPEEIADASTAPVVTFENVRSAVIADLTAKTAQNLANKAAQDFALTLYRNSIQRDTPEFKELLTIRQLEMIEIPPYTAKEAGSRGLPAEMLESAFAMSENRYFSDVYPIDNQGFGVLIFSKRLPPEVPPYPAVAEIVKADFIAQEKRRLFNEEGMRLKEELSARLETETTFKQAAEELGLTVNEYEACTLAEAPKTINRAVLQRVQSMDQGGLSPMITIGDTGLFVYIDSKNVPKIKADDEQLKQAEKFLQRYGAFVGASATLNELVANGQTDE